MIQGLSGPHLIAIVFIIVLLFGAPKLPALAKSLGQSAKILKREVSSDDPVDGETQPSEPTKPSGSAGAN
ncbi:Sec-independent protein translocase protein TatA [Leucobacter aridicollis]|uniref:Sec-independent protein translocase protein TatA n=1 Tax=Leucobacter aridicollis TaxID=283878 RepID=A0A852QZA2_9MICO|nr:twin-arginine translocase TatA/TatE family subunit [Leucobacter aridicollis]MBL3683310.1 preprotein translocase [Leucobacter aridicollis]MCS3429415.1 sec-independent protein translocase protein TatA [Leucobacter aridicollis]NYD25547.1 sec-independent protein translocase protein TatA [Leucobacter aridicollis]RKQ89726.1 sec-independent protein translocase protein TatA [Mycolicibacterium mucogenicum 261Sha1.1M5]